MFDETKEINIKFENKYNSTFVRANHWLITANKEDIYSNEDPEKALADLWQSHFNARIIKQDGKPYKLSFDSQEDLTVFMLKWG